MSGAELAVPEVCKLLDRDDWVIFEGAQCREHDARGRLVTEVTVTEGTFTIKSGDLSFTVPADQILLKAPYRLFFGSRGDDASLVLMNPRLGLASRDSAHQQAENERQTRINETRPAREETANWLTSQIERRAPGDRIVQEVLPGIDGFAISFGGWSLPIRVNQAEPKTAVVLVTAELHGLLQLPSHLEAWWINTGQHAVAWNRKARHLTEKIGEKTLGGISARDDGANLLFADGTSLPLHLDIPTAAKQVELAFFDETGPSEQHAWYIMHF